MPLKKVICADPALLRKGHEVTLSVNRCLACAAQRTNPCGYTYETLRGMYSERAPVLTGEYFVASVTAVLGKCQRSYVLQQRVDYAESPKSMWPRYRGTLTHALLAGTRAPGTWGEERLWAPHPSLPNAWLTGQPDLVDPEHGVLMDYKTAKELPRYGGVWGDHEAQVQLYRWLVDHATHLGEAPPWEEGTKPMPDEYRPREWTRLAIVYLTDSAVEEVTVTESVTVPKANGEGTKRARVPSIWSDDEVVDYFVPRYQVLYDAFTTGELPPIPEGWEGWTGWKCNGYCSVKKACVEMTLGGA